MSYRKSRSRKERRRSSLNSASFLLTQMFEWSRFRIDVRTFVDQQVSVIPTIIRIVDPVEKFEFYAGTV